VTAYWVSQYRVITDETRMAAYAALARPALEAARAAHDTPAYQDALAALGDGAVRDIRIVPGLD
jgi:uncharacterized protein (DUF1330 family)